MYFILLTLWGLEYMREVRRLKALIALAESTNTAVRDVEISQLAADTSRFGVLRPAGAKGSYLFPVINIVGLATAAVLILARYAAAFRFL